MPFDNNFSDLIQSSGENKTKKFKLLVSVGTRPKKKEVNTIAIAIPDTPFEFLIITENKIPTAENTIPI